ncbi:MAG TPA: pilus assembly protein TadG-related protein, partial [Acidimicrobiia bacterium]|nr:pilus assembly protein TadG-related protein [Acidimicrobiia bacterium]
MKDKRASDGFSAVWVALILLFLLGAAALAVDASGFWQQARVQQNASDFACLAGVRHAPSDPPAAVNKAAEYLRANMSALSALPADPDSGAASSGVNVYTMSDFTIQIETPWDDGNAATRNDALMRVSILQTTPSTFGRVIGIDDVDILQEAY